jgi:heme/copper-type cytochrome/quinol oxidase subunit 2
MTRTVLIVIIAVLAASGAIVGVVLFKSGFGKVASSSGVCSVLSSNINIAAPGVANSSAAGSSATFTIIDSDPGSNYEGMNGSAFHTSTQWPVIQVRQGQNVTIRVYNCASSESHGFAITHYFNYGATVAPGQSFTLKFTANQVGSFRVYCSIFCAIHPLMQNGELIVTPATPG